MSPNLSLAFAGVARRKVGGAGGATLVSDLARQLPVPTQNGRVYHFELRAGVRYSDGTPVRAADVRASFERMLKLNGRNLPPFYSAIKGASQCVTQPRACDLSSGIQTDDATSSVTFNLTSPRRPTWPDSREGPVLWSTSRTSGRLTRASNRIRFLVRRDIPYKLDLAWIE